EAGEHEDARRRENEVQVELHLLGDLEDFGVPDIRLTIDHVERVRVDDERATRIREDVEELQRLRRGPAFHDRGVLVVERAVAGTVELILGSVPRHAASEMRAFAIRRDDSPGRMDQEELSLEVEDRRVVRRLECREEAVFRANRQLHPETHDLVGSYERDDERRDLGDRQKCAGQKPQPEEMPSLDPTDESLRRRFGVGPDHAFGSRHWWVAGTAQGAKRSIPGPRMDVPTTVSTRYTATNPV